MKALKLIAVIFVLLVLIVIGVGVFVVYNTNRLIDRGIETVGSAYLGVPVTLESVDFSWAEGRSTLTGLEIQNPTGFEGAHAMRFGDVTVVLNAMESTADRLVLSQVTIDGARLAAVFNGPDEMNFQTLVRNLQAPSTGQMTQEADFLTGHPVKLIIDRLDFTGAEATLSGPMLGKETVTGVRDIHLTHIGRDSNGVTGAEVMKLLLEPITRSLVRDAVELHTGFGPVENGLDESAERLRSLGHPTD